MIIGTVKDYHLNNFERAFNNSQQSPAIAQDGQMK